MGTSLKMSKRFENGLKKYGLTIEDLNDFYYIGGEHKQHKAYYNLFTNNNKLPKHNNYCICGHKIKNNCYISNGDIVLPIGESCILRFLQNRKKRICPVCFCPHRNRIKTNLCNVCKMKTYFKNGFYKIEF